MNLRILILSLSQLLCFTLINNVAVADKVLPTVSFSASMECEDDEVVFTNNSTTTAVSIVFYSWDFGDGTGSTVRNPRHTYTLPGTYLVSLTIQDSNGDVDTGTEPVVVRARPQVDFSINASDFCTNTLVSFTNLTGLAIGTIDTYVWDFGDMTPTVGTIGASHAYTTEGTYVVSLTVSANGGCSQTITKNVTIKPRPVVDFLVTDICLDQSLEVTNLTTISSGNLSYSWDFGDGMNSILKEPTYTYTMPGDYTITLTATSTDGICAAFNTKMITVHPVPVASFTFNDHCFDTPASIVNNSTISAGTMTYKWDFGDGTTSTDETPNKVFTLPGSYNVTLTAVSNNNCENIISKFVKVYPEPTAAFIFQDNCVNNSVNFTNNSIIESGTLGYSWNFGDGATSILENPSHTYTIPNTYTVTLTATSGNTCVDILTKQIVISPETVAGNITGAQTICGDDATVYLLTLNGATGNVLRWESSATGDEPWNIISNTSTTLNYNSLIATTHYRAIVKSGTCDEEISNTVIVTIDEETSPGVLVGENTVCTGTNTGQLMLNDEVGNILEWQSAKNASGPFTAIANITDMLTYTNLTEDTWYRVRVRNGLCLERLSNIVKISVSKATDAGVLSASGTFCKGDNSGTLNLANNEGDVIRWETSNTGLSPWASINNITTSLDYNNLLNTTFYRVVVKSGVCEAEISNAVKITIDEPTVAGRITGIEEVCDQLNAGILTLNDFLGTIVKWESSVDDATWTDITNVTSQLSFNNLNETTFYRALVKNGVCDEVYSNSFQVKVNPLPEVSFTAENVCVGALTQFENTSTISSGSINSYFWDFGGGQVSVAKDPIFRFAGAGIYPVKLVVTSTAGCKDSSSVSIQVFEKPTANFEFDNKCIGFNIPFTNSSLGGLATISSNSWDFGDGNASTDSDPEHQYENPGTYTVKLTVVNANSCQDEITKQVTVFEPGKAGFNFENVCDGQSVNFANTSVDPEEEGTYQWSFGDGTGSTEMSPSHTFERFGDYTVNLILTTSNGCVSDSSRIVTVYEQPKAGFKADNVCFGTAINFTDTTVYTQTDLTYEWDFGNGDTSNEQSPSYTFPETGKYRVSLMVRSANDCSSSAFSFFDVEPIPEVRFLAGSACEDQEIAFTNLTSQSIDGLEYTWDFGDGTSSDEFEPTHIYENEGVFTAKLTVDSGFGCSEFATQQVTVHAIPVVDFEFTNVCDGFEMNFTNKSTITTGTIIEYLWDFGDFSNSIFENPIKNFLNSGTYEVTLTAVSSNGCISQTTKTVEVYQNPVANFRANAECLGTPVVFENISRTASGTLLNNWTLGDGSVSAARTPSYIYDAPGSYPVKLIVTSPEGCVDSVSQQVTVFRPPVITASPDTVVSQGFPVQLLGTGGTQYVWTPVSILSNSNIANPIATPLENTTFTVFAKDAQGCEGEAQVTVNVINDFRIEPSNALTPDGNGKNDTWVIQNVETFGDVNVRVYDRSGRIVFEERAYKNTWSGTSGSDILPDGDYFYLVTFSASERIYKGTLTIIRND